LNNGKIDFSLVDFKDMMKVYADKQKTMYDAIVLSSGTGSPLDLVALNTNPMTYFTMTTDRIRNSTQLN